MTINYKPLDVLNRNGDRYYRWKGGGIVSAHEFFHRVIWLRPTGGVRRIFLSHDMTSKLLRITLTSGKLTARLIT